MERSGRTGEALCVRGVWESGAERERKREGGDRETCVENGKSGYERNVERGRGR